MPPLSRRQLLAALATVAPAFAQSKQAASPQDPRKYTPTAGSAVPNGAIAAVSDGPFAGSRWRASYVFDESHRRCRLQQFAMPTPKLGVVAMVVSDEEKMSDQAQLLITRDGGANWTRQKCDKNPLGVAVYGDKHAWVVFPGKLQASVDGGVKWEKYKLPHSALTRVRFSNEREGWAWGRGKVFYRTSDGGATWSAVAESEKLELHSSETYLRSMDILPNGLGVIGGDSAATPPTGAHLPDWMVPDSAIARRVVPGSALLYETRDGGKSWSPNLSSAFGRVARVRLGGMRPVLVMQYEDAFAWPAELYDFDLQNGQVRTLFRRKELVVQDVLLLEGGGVLLAATQPSGRLRSAPLPAKVRVFWTADRQHWFELKVDYRVVGAEVAFETCSDGAVWLATDEGVVAKLVQAAAQSPAPAPAQP